MRARLRRASFEGPLALERSTDSMAQTFSSGFGTRSCPDLGNLTDMEATLSPTHWGKDKQLRPVVGVAKTMCAANKDRDKRYAEWNSTQPISPDGGLTSMAMTGGGSSPFAEQYRAKCFAGSTMNSTSRASVHKSLKVELPPMTVPLRH
mmetsp:Transcript_9002/g.26689  ORF Transcript_9002/g.26689 Transcript_9002/m.26689 type:complete len:149 (+) Transcript_9002:3-449(+)